MSVLRGEYWLDTTGAATFADGDVSDDDHMTLALWAALEIDPEEERFAAARGSKVDIVPLEKWNEQTLEFLEDRGANKIAVERLKDGGDPRAYAMEMMGWTRVANDNFQVWNFNDEALKIIQRSDVWENTDDPESLDDSDETITIEQMSDNKTWTVSLKDLFKAKSAEGLKRYKDGIGKWRNPSRDNIVVKKYPDGHYDVWVNRSYIGTARVSGDRLTEFPRSFTAEQKRELLRQIMREEKSGNPSSRKKLRLFHGTTEESAKHFMEYGWKPRIFGGGNGGQGKYLYLTNMPDNARWFSEQQGSCVVVEISGLVIGDIIVDPEDGTKDTVEEEIGKKDFPAYLATEKPLKASQFKIYDGPFEEECDPVEFNPPYFHGSHKEWKVYDLEVAHALGTGFTSAFDHLGLWLTSDKDRAKNYGPLVHEFDITLENPLVIERERDHAGFQSEHQPFAEALYDEKLAKKHLSAEDRKAIKAGAEIPWRSREIKRVLKAPETPGSYRDDVQLGLKLLKKKRAFDEAMHRLYKNVVYWTALRDFLLASGHDAILFKDSLIDVKVDTKPHDVIVYLRPAKVRAL